MKDFENSITIQAPRQQVVDYVSDVSNMPNYLPTVTEARMDGEDRVWMAVEIKGERHEDSGYFRALEDRLEWGSEDHDYHGEMHVEGDGEQSEVTIRLHINPPKELAERMDENSSGDWQSKTQNGLLEALQAIKEQTEAPKVYLSENS